MRMETMGGLKVRITGGTDGDGGGDGPVVVLLHGFGAPGDDLVTLWRSIAAPGGTRWAFPEAPHALPGYGDARAWWMIDLERRQRALQMGRPRELLREVPAGLDRARMMLTDMLAELYRKLGVTAGRTVIGGFSQGAMLACDGVLRAEASHRAAGLVMLSGTIVAEDDWSPRFVDRTGFPVFQSHGREDPLLPFEVAELLRDRWEAAGANVTWVPFTGGHTITPHVLDRLGGFLKALPLASTKPA